MARLAVFASGRGSNFVAIANALKETRHVLEFLLCDVEGAPVLERAEKMGVPTVPVSYGGVKRENVEKKIVRHLERRRVDIVALAGFMRLLTPWFLQAFKGPVINVHPSLLPKYPGVHGIEESYASGDSELGITIMRVDEGVDTGPASAAEVLSSRAGGNQGPGGSKNPRAGARVVSPGPSVDARQDRCRRRAMRVLVLGSGAREHALAWKLAGSQDVSAVFAGPGNAGTAEVCTNLPDVAPMKFDTVLSAARRVSADCVFVGPEIPLAAGVIDFLERRGIPGFGPGKKAAQLESSKAFSKAFLVRNRIPTARATEFSDPSVFEAFLRREEGRRLVVKKSGLAAGKGVLESSRTEELLSFGKDALSGDSVLLEEYLEGWELSVFGVSDGESHVVLPGCTDFKKAHDGDTGPNTAGWGPSAPYRALTVRS